MAEWNPQANALFLEALDRPAGPVRTAFLDQACDDDDQLKAQVIALLAANEQAGEFLSSPAQEFRETSLHSARGDRPGSAIGSYKLLQQIGEGGMGVVYMAEQSQPVRRTVALKILKPGMDSRQIVARFAAERQALALMDHPNIAHVFDAGTTDAGRPYFVMELVKGVPITKYCDDNHLTPRQRLELFIPVCKGVQHAHQKGIIHRDLKPSNVMIAKYDGQPVPKVIDFGVAKATGPKLTDQTLFTEFGAVLGTLEYMSPEQAELNQLDVDTRSDIYSLGVLLYELLTGSTPLQRQRAKNTAVMELLRLIREEEPPRPSTRLSTAEALPSIAASRGMEPKKLTGLIRGDLDWIVMKALEKDRNRRYETANSLATDLAHYLADEPVGARPPSRAYLLRKFVRRHKGPVVATVIFLLLLLGGIIGTTWGLIRATDARAVAVNETKHKEAALEAAQQSERNATDKLWLSLYERARAGRYSRQMGQRLDTLAALADAARIRPDALLRDEAIAAMALPDVRRGPRWHGFPPGTATLVFGPHYRVYARLDSQGNISVRSIPDDRELQRIEANHITGFHLYFSPDERFLMAFGTGSKLRVWRVADGQLVMRAEPGKCTGYAFSPDGRIVAVGQEKSVIFFDLATGQEINRWSIPGQTSSLAYHPKGGQVAVGYANPGITSVYDVASGTVVAELPVDAIGNQTVAWHPDGERLAVAGSDPRIQIWNVADKRRAATLEGHVQHVPAVTFHPDGNLLASRSWDGHLRLWDPATGRPLLQLAMANMYGVQFEFSRDGRWLGAALHGEQVELLELTWNREYRTLVSSGRMGVSAVTPSDISPDGGLLVVGKVEGAQPGARLWDLQSGRELAALPPGTDWVFFDSTGATDGSAAAESAELSLLTCGSAGLWRWPITSEDPKGKHLHLGPPRKLSSLQRARFSRSQDGRALAAMTEVGGRNQIIDLETGVLQQQLGVHPNGEVRALSADGRWAASSGWHSGVVRLWNVGTGQMVHEWRVGIQTFVLFTPDSRKLIISRGDEISFWDVETLQPTVRLRRDVAQIPSYVAFSPDGKLMALEMSPAIIHLKEVANGRTVAKLEDPHGDRATWHGFTPDGTQLVVVSSYSGAIHIWDLRSIRTRLKEMNLDWDWPEFSRARIPLPPREGLGEGTGQTESETSRFAQMDGTGHQPMTIEVILGELAKPALSHDAVVQEAIKRSRRNLQATPESARACNELAWILVSAPEKFRNAEEAVPLAEKAVRLEPTALHRNTLAVAYYRIGRYREAVELLRVNLTDQRDSFLAFDLYFLAMSYHQLGDTVRARDYYDWAVRWTNMQKLGTTHNEELAAFRAEAEELLGINPPER
jgi:serine/threonine protein kinase/WD40 repeat protein